MVSKNSKKKQVSQQQQQQPPATSTTTTSSSATATKLTKQLGPDATATLTTKSSSTSMEHESVSYGEPVASTSSSTPVLAASTASSSPMPAAGVRSYSRSSKSKAAMSSSQSSYTEKSQSKLQSQSQSQSEQFSSSSSSTAKISRDYSNEKIIASIDLLESEKKEPVFSVPIEVVEITTPTLSMSASGGSLSKMYTSSSMSSSQQRQQQQASSSSTYFASTTSSSSNRSANETLIASERADTAATGMTSSGARKQVGFDTSSSTNTNTNISVDVNTNTNTNTNTKSTSSSSSKSFSESQSVPKLPPASGTADGPTSVTSSSCPEPVAAPSAVTTTKGTSSTSQNDKLEQLSGTTTAVDHNKATSSTSKKEVSESTTRSSSSSTKQSTSSSKKEVYDVKTKTWTELSDGTNPHPGGNTSKPTFERYVSKESDGSCKVTYKKKIYDRRNNRWRVVDERTVDSTADRGYPEIVDDVINTTTTTYTTKVYDTKLGKWTVVDEKSYRDSKAFVPNDIAREIEKDNTDVANITTTTEVTKIFDASINDWRVLDEKVHTDVIEKIVETPKKTIYVDEFVEIEKNTSISENNENITLNLNETSKHKNITENIYDEIDYVRTDKKRLDDSRNRGVVKNKNTTHSERCICEICTCGRHHCSTSTTKSTENTIIETDAESEEKREELQNAVEDYKVKLSNFDQNVNELRAQLDQVSAERDHLLETVRSNEQIASSFRQEKNSIIEERDSLLTLIERQNAELERLKEDLHSYRQQLSNAISAKCEAIARVDEIQSKEVALQTKEQRIENERIMLQNEIRLLNSDLNRNNSELQNIRRENSLNTIQLENSLREKCDALQILQAEHAQVVEVVGQLNEKIGELTSNAYKQSMASEKYVATLKNELDAKNKLFEIYKSTEEQNQADKNELLQGIAEMKRMLSEVTEQHDKVEAELSSTKQQHSSELAERDATITDLRKEISEANRLLAQSKGQSLEEAICKLSPSAAVASRVIHPDFTITELYLKYVKALDELELANLDNSKMKLHMESMYKEIQERAPEIEQLRIDFENLKEAYDHIIPERDVLLGKKQCLEETLDRATFDLKSITKNNQLLEKSTKDLGRQVCTLLDELNCLRAGVRHVNHNRSGDSTSQSTNFDVITDQLVTFDSIVELQAQNQKLLQLTRQLAQTMDEQENERDTEKLEMNRERVKRAQERCSLLEEQLTEKNNALNLLSSKCERYQKYFFAAQKRQGRQTVNLDDSAADMDVSESSTLNTSAKAAEHTKEEVRKLEQRIHSLEKQLVEETNKYASLKENYEYYTSEKRKNDALAQEQFDSMRKEVRELTSNNCKLLNATDFQKEQIDILNREH
ncbi:GL17207 [Drosophila persimilis]|uniref:GL17207 n=1 Tax=Drosophila persimilis TaxID=7234 RepID=B4GG50_DROPE|nr:GL17207 [Drosophila persimilis]